MRRAAVTAAAVVALLARVSVAHGAASARLDVFPSHPRVGQTVTVQLRPFWTFSDGTLAPALFPSDYRWSVAAISWSGRSLVRIARTPGNPYLWSGTTKFGMRGSWTICVLNFSSTGRACVPHSPGWQRLRVRPRGAPLDVWQRLERPFHIPTIAGGSRCPTTGASPNGDLSRIPGFVGTAWGGGPAYPGGLDVGEGKPVLRYEDPILPGSAFYGSAWSGNKVLWIVDPVYRGPLLIRGRQLDGPNELRFDNGILPPRTLKIPSAAARNRASYTRVRGPGCYAYQIDGLGFSYVIVFEATPF